MVEPPSTAAWDTLRSGPVAALKPISEMESTVQLYIAIDMLSNAQSRAWDAEAHARLYATRAQDPRNLSPAELDQAIAAVQDLLVAHFKEAVALQSLCRQGASVGFKPCLTRTELLEWSNTISPQQLISIYGASAQTFIDKQKMLSAQEHSIDTQLQKLNANQ